MCADRIPLDLESEQTSQLSRSASQRIDGQSLRQEPGDALNRWSRLTV